MSTLLDTNVLTRSVQLTHSDHKAAEKAINTLLQRGVMIHLVPQNFYEFWVVATRPIAQNGLGFTPAVAKYEIDRIKKLYTISTTPQPFFLSGSVL